MQRMIFTRAWGGFKKGTIIQPTQVLSTAQMYQLTSDGKTAGGKNTLEPAPDGVPMIPTPNPAPKVKAKPAEVPVVEPTPEPKTEPEPEPEPAEAVEVAESTEPPRRRGPGRPPTRFGGGRK